MKKLKISKKVIKVIGLEELSETLKNYTDKWQLKNCQERLKLWYINGYWSYKHQNKLQWVKFVPTSKY